MNEDEAASIIHRVMRHLEKEDTSPSVVVAERRVELAPFQRRMIDGGLETLYCCGNCHMQAMIELVEDGEG